MSDFADAPARPRGRLARWRRGLRRYAWLPVLAAAATALVLGYIGFRTHSRRMGETLSPSDAFYLSLQLFGLNSGAVEPPAPLSLQVARILAPLTVAFTLASVIAGIFREPLVTARVRLMKNHVVVCGLGAKGMLLARAFSALGYRVVAIDDDGQAEGIAECREEGATIMVGDATEPALLRRAGVARADYLIAAGGDDGMNAEVAVAAGDAAAFGGQLEVFVHIVDPTLCNLLRERQRGRQAAVRLHFFNVFESGSRAWLELHPPFGPVGRPHARPHLLIVGAGRLGRSLLLGAVRNWLTLHADLGNAGARDLPQAPPLEARPLVTLVARDAERKADWLRLEHPQLDDFCQLSYHNADVSTPPFAHTEFPGVSTAYVCLDDDGLGVAVGAGLARQLAGTGAEVVVRVERAEGLGTLLDERARRTQAPRAGSADPPGNAAPAGAAPVHAFPLVDMTCSPEMLLGQTTHEAVARAIHARWLTSERAGGEARNANGSAVGWTELPEDIRASARRRAEHVDVKLAAVGCERAPLTDRDEPPFAFAEEEIEVMAELEHKLWAGERLFEERTPSIAHDPDRRTSPHLVAWHGLDEETKALNRNTVRLIPEILHSAGFSVRRRVAG